MDRVAFFIAIRITAFLVAHSSTYYIFSRVFHPWIKKINKDDTLEYMSEINRMGSLFPNFGDYGTQRLFILTLKK